MNTLSPLERVCRHVQQFDASLQPLVYEEAMKTSLLSLSYEQLLTITGGTVIHAAQPE
ncbi:hypothetical protein JQN58_14765 [Aneurinibacillus sp. BA2021]|nr:hypothetical protein [Aneurinibacillus sp. BA2021]